MPANGEAPQPPHADGLYTIRTPEMVEFSFQLGGPCSRLLAWLVDLGVVIAACLAALSLLLCVSATLSLVSQQAGALLMLVFGLVAYLILTCYGIFYEQRWNGQTPGKRLLQLRVLSTQGLSLTLAQSVIRNLLRSIDSLPFAPAPVSLFPSYLIGFTCCCLTDHQQRIGDVIAQSIVVHEEKRPLPATLKLPAPKHNKLLEDPTLLTRLGKVIKPDERELLIALVQRRNELALATRARLFEALATHFHERLMTQIDENFLSDENWILNLTGAILHNEERMLTA